MDISLETAFRPSISPGVAQCASYMWRPGGLDVREAAGERAEIGTALHEIFKNYITKDKVVDLFCLNFYADKYMVDVDGFEGIAWRARKMEAQWQQVKEFYPNPHVEETVVYKLPNGIKNEGTPDLWQECDGFVCLLDLKTGMMDSDYRKQLLDYCLIIYKVHKFQDFYASVFNPVLDYYETWHFTLQEILEWEKTLLFKMTRVGKEFFSGKACEYCNNLSTCPAHIRAVQSYFPHGLDEPPMDLPTITPEVLRRVRPVMTHLKKVYEEYDKLENALLDKHGSIDLGDGYELTRAVRFKKKFNVPRCIQVMTESFGIQLGHILEATKLPSKAIENLAGTVALKRQKGKTVTALKDSLKVADAYTETPEHYRVVRVKQIAPEKVESEEVDG